ncbi:hypothetical protein GPECTOR_1g32 [Gonium pectorale]|uniref:Uncharacterized protein n=1 Tax=Gonium pectorale TaxID=33097 RepID=A0A150H2R3_GONPE|nr:hypothetical protein GPECTOR_1g32 [Gonium pectorale]|eukprot:KXZ56361.1 hypothetical protein GPECTOR_1g32 [Gonium pectorale]
MPHLIPRLFKQEPLQRKITQLQDTIRERDAQLVAAGKEVEKAKQDGQLETFMVVAQRQIAYLEGQVRDLQKAE